MKFFNTSGPVRLDDHYYIHPLKRWDLDSVLLLIEQKKYFVIHAPRQTGKTSCILALSHYLNTEGKFKVLYVNVEPAQAAREDVNSGIQTVIDMILSADEMSLKTSGLRAAIQEIKKDSDNKSLLFNSLKIWTELSNKPTVLIIDEIDSLVGDTLISVLRQLRAGYTNRPEYFPQSIILCGVRDVRDYRMHATNTGKDIITGGSAFNIKDESLRLGNFTQEEISQLYQEHTQETGQVFEEGIFELVWQYTRGQPWLVNALAYEACFEIKQNRDREKPITVLSFQEAKENLILRRDTHLDQLSDKLKEERVRKVIEPILMGDELSTNATTDDIQYVIDLGLVIKDGNLKIANSIYQEVIPRELAYSTQIMLVQESLWYADKETGSLNFMALLKEFQNFFRKNSEHWIGRYNYAEAGPQLLLQAFLQRIINGGGQVEREYGLGRRRTDLYICWYPKGKENQSIKQEVVIECKILYNDLEETIEKGLEQTASYADKCGAKEAHLLIFDRTKDKLWNDKIFVKEMEYNKKPIIVWGM